MNTGPLTSHDQDRAIAYMAAAYDEGSHGFTSYNAYPASHEHEGYPVDAVAVDFYVIRPDGATAIEAVVFDADGTILD